MKDFDAFSPAQCFGYVVLVLGVTAFLQRDDRRLRLMTSIQSMVYMVHFVLLGLPASAAGSLISGTRSFLSLKTRSPWAAALMLALGAGLGSYIARDLYGYLPIFLTSLATIVIFSSCGRRSAWAAAVTFLLGAGLGAFLAKDIFCYIPVVATSIATLAIFFTDGIRMRLALLCCTFMWLANNLHGRSYGGTVLECIIATTNGLTIARMALEQRAERGVETA